MFNLKFFKKDDSAKEIERLPLRMQSLETAMRNWFQQIGNMTNEIVHIKELMARNKYIRELGGKYIVSAQSSYNEYVRYAFKTGKEAVEVARALGAEIEYKDESLGVTVRRMATAEIGTDPLECK